MYNPYYPFWPLLQVGIGVSMGVHRDMQGYIGIRSDSQGCIGAYGDVW